MFLLRYVWGGTFNFSSIEFHLDPFKLLVYRGKIQVSIKLMFHAGSNC